MQDKKNTEVKQACIFDVMPSFYFFDINRRIYEKDGIKSNSPVYEEHFVKIKILEENDKEYICQFGKTINKKSMLYRIDSKTRKWVYTEKEKEDNIYVNSKAYKLAEIVRKSNADTLRIIEDILFKNNV